GRPALRRAEAAGHPPPLNCWFPPQKRWKKAHPTPPPPLALTRAFMNRASPRLSVIAARRRARDRSPLPVHENDSWHSLKSRRSPPGIDSSNRSPSSGESSEIRLGSTEY